MAMEAEQRLERMAMLRAFTLALGWHARVVCLALSRPYEGRAICERALLMNPALVEHRVEAVRAGTQSRPLGRHPSTAERRAKDVAPHPSLVVRGTGLCPSVTRLDGRPPGQSNRLPEA